MDRRQAGRGGPGDLDALLVGAGLEQLGDLAQQVLHAPRGGVQLDRRLAQLGEVQHVVDQGQQVVAAFAQRPDIGPLLGGQARALQQAAPCPARRSAAMQVRRLQGAELLGGDSAGH